MMSRNEEDSSDMEEESNNEEFDEERNAIRSQLSTMSFEDLQKLKEKIGTKVYKEALFGKNDKKETYDKKIYKRENKNRPRERSAKKPVPMLGVVHKVKERVARDPRYNKIKKIYKRENKNRPRERSAKKPVPMLGVVHKVKERVARDPRFDPLCGEFDKKQFAENYNFLSDVRIQDIKAIRAELKETTDPNRVMQLKRLLQRLNDQHKASKKIKVETEQRERQRKEVEKEFMEGKQPQFKKKSELRVEALVKQYEELSKEGGSRVLRHLRRRQQKAKKRSHKAPTGVS